MITEAHAEGALAERLDGAWRWRAWPARRRGVAWVVVTAASQDETPGSRDVQALAADAAARLGREPVGADTLRTGPDHRITEAGERAAALLGVAPEALLGLSLSDVLAERLDIRWRVEDTQPGEVRGAWLPPSGSDDDVVALKLTRPVVPDATPGGVVATLRSRAAIQPFSSIRDEHVAAIRHEMRAPLTVVRGVAATLVEDPEMPTEHRARFLTSLNREAGRVAAFAEDLLIVLRLIASRRLYQTQVVDVREALGEPEARCREHAATRGVAWDCSMPAAAAPVLAEPALFTRLIDNLLAQPLKLARAGDRISVAVVDDARTVTLSVTVVGEDLPRAAWVDAFTRFARSPAEGKRTPSVGLGLGIVRAIGDTHGWRVGVMGGDGQSYRVEVEIPRANAARPEALIN